MWLPVYWTEYLKARGELDNSIQFWVKRKEELILQNPLVHPFLKDYEKVRKYKTKKLRIYYFLSRERPELYKQLFDSEPNNNEVVFLYVALRDEDTYKELAEIFRKHNI